MPEAVEAFAESGFLADAGAVHASIIETYRDDFAKYGTRSEIRRLRQVYDFVPAAVGEKFKYSRVDSGAKSREIKKALQLLVMARVVRRVTHCDSQGLPFGATLKESVFKTFFLDVGLVHAACGIDRLSPEEVASARFVNEGAAAEQFVAQHLPLSAPDDRTFVPTYWLREGRANNAEIDFVQQIGADVVPIEVKAGKSGTLRSLHEFMGRRGLERAVRFDTNPPSVHSDLPSALSGRPAAAPVVGSLMARALSRSAWRPKRRFSSLCVAPHTVRGDRSIGPLVFDLRRRFARLGHSPRASKRHRGFGRRGAIAHAWNRFTATTSPMRSPPISVDSTPLQFRICSHSKHLRNRAT